MGNSPTNHYLSPLHDSQYPFLPPPRPLHDLASYWHLPGHHLGYRSLHRIAPTHESKRRCPLAQPTFHGSHQPGRRRYVWLYLSLYLSAHQWPPPRLPAIEKIPTTSIPQLLDYRRDDRSRQFRRQDGFPCPTL